MMGNDPYGQTVAAPAPPYAPKKRSLKWLWITLGVVGALIIVGGGAAVFALVQYAQPASAAATFCQDLKTQNYDAAYGMLSAKLKAAYTDKAFAAATPRSMSPRARSRTVARPAAAEHTTIAWAAARRR